MSSSAYKKEWLIIALSKELQIREDILTNAFNKWMVEYSKDNPQFIEEIKDAEIQGPTEDTSSSDREGSRVHLPRTEIKPDYPSRKVEQSGTDKPSKIHSRLKIKDR
jgi:hypothetical protein